MEVFGKHVSSKQIGIVVSVFAVLLLGIYLVFPVAQAGVYSIFSEGEHTHDTNQY